FHARGQSLQGRQPHPPGSQASHVPALSLSTALSVSAPTTVTATPVAAVESCLGRQRHNPPHVAATEIEDRQRYWFRSEGLGRVIPQRVAYTPAIMVARPESGDLPFHLV